MQISPQKVATLLNLAKRSTGTPSKGKVQIATNPHIYKNWGKKPTKYAYAFKLVNCKRDKKTSQVNIYLNKIKARRMCREKIQLQQNDNDNFYYYSRLSEGKK